MVNIPFWLLFTPGDKECNGEVASELGRLTSLDEEMDSRLGGFDPRSSSSISPSFLESGNEIFVILVGKFFCVTR